MKGIRYERLAVTDPLEEIVSVVVFTIGIGIMGCSDLESCW